MERNDLRQPPLEGGRDGSSDRTIGLCSDQQKRCEIDNAVELLGRYSKTVHSWPKLDHLLKLTAKPASDLRKRSSPPRTHTAKRRLGKEQIAALVVAYVAGAPSTQLMVDFGLGKGAVLRLLDEAGVVRRPTKLSQADIAKAIELYGQGWSFARLGQRFGVDPHRLWRRFKQLGVPRRQPWERPSP